MANSRIPDSFAEFVKFVGQMARGLVGGGRADAQQKEYGVSLARAVEMLVRLDRRQEALKAQLGRTTGELEASLRSTRAIVGKVVSYLEWMHGKTSPELVHYGLTPRRVAGGRKPKGVPAGSAAQ